MSEAESPSRKSQSPLRKSSASDIRRDATGAEGAKRRSLIGGEKTSYSMRSVDVAAAFKELEEEQDSMRAQDARVAFAGSGSGTSLGAIGEDESDPRARKGEGTRSWKRDSERERSHGRGKKRSPSLDSDSGPTEPRERRAVAARRHKYGKPRSRAEQEGAPHPLSDTQSTASSETGGTEQSPFVESDSGPTEPRERRAAAARRHKPGKPSSRAEQKGALPFPGVQSPSSPEAGGETRSPTLDSNSGLTEPRERQPSAVSRQQPDGQSSSSAEQKGAPHPLSDTQSPASSETGGTERSPSVELDSEVTEPRERHPSVASRQQPGQRGVNAEQEGAHPLHDARSPPSSEIGGTERSSSWGSGSGLTEPRERHPSAVSRQQPDEQPSSRAEQEGAPHPLSDTQSPTSSKTGEIVLSSSWDSDSGLTEPRERYPSAASLQQAEQRSARAEQEGAHPLADAQSPASSETGAWRPCYDTSSTSHPRRSRQSSIMRPDGLPGVSQWTQALVSSTDSRSSLHFISSTDDDDDDDEVLSDSSFKYAPRPQAKELPTKPQKSSEKTAVQKKTPSKTGKSLSWLCH